MKNVVCDQCKSVIHEYAQHFTLVSENTPTTFASPYTEKQFCNAMCLAKFAANLMGKELVDVDAGPDDAAQGRESGSSGVAQKS